MGGRRRPSNAASFLALILFLTIHSRRRLNLLTCDLSLTCTSHKDALSPAGWSSREMSARCTRWLGYTACFRCGRTKSRAWETTGNQQHCIRAAGSISAGEEERNRSHEMVWFRQS